MGEREEREEREGIRERMREGEEGNERWEMMRDERGGGSPHKS